MAALLFSRNRCWVILTALLSVTPIAFGAEIAFVYADRPSTDQYVVENDATYSPFGQPVTVSRSSRGVYNVSFGDNVGTPERNLQVSAVGMQGGYCKLFGWTQSATTVGCFNMLGDPTDMAFNALLTLADSETRFLVADQPGSASYAPADRTTSMSLRGRVTIERVNDGFYYIHAPGIAQDGIGIQVTATGRDANYCIDGRSNRGRAEVRCFAPSADLPRGEPADSGFSILFTSTSGPNVAYAYVYCDSEPCVVVPRHARIPEGEQVIVRDVQAGKYEIDFGSIVGPGTNLQIVAVDRLPRKCVLESWEEGIVRVGCYDTRGSWGQVPFYLLAHRAPSAVSRTIGDIGDEIGSAGPGSPSGPVVPPVTPPGSLAGSVIDFDALPDGAPIPADQVLRFEYQELGAIFPNGVRATRCSVELTCSVAGNQAGRPLPRGEFDNQAFIMNLTRGRQRVAFHVIASNASRASSPVTATAFNEAGEMVDTVTTAPLAPGRDIQINLRSSASVIAWVVVNREVSGEGGDNLLFVDAISLYGDGDLFAAYAEDSRPTVSISQPAMNAELESAYVAVVLDASDAHGLASVDVQLQTNAGDIVIPFSEGSVCGVATDCGGSRFSGSIDLPLTDEGYYVILSRACSVTGSCTVQQTTFRRSFPERQDVDLWVMGLEYNQQWQDTIYTDLLNDGSEAGRVPLRHPSNRDTELALPIVAGKPMVVRAYVGIRDGAGLSDGVPVRGNLRVSDGTAGGMSWNVPALVNADCASHLDGARPSAGQRCLDQVIAYPTLGRLDYTTNTAYDLDLIRQRIHWEGTLNFVLPPEITDRALDATRGGSGLTFNFEVEPVDAWDETSNPDGIWTETNSRDNQFELQLEQAEREVLRIHLVRVAMPGSAAPSREDAHRAISEMERILPISGVEIARESEFFYDGSTVTLEADFLGAEINEELLNQCNTLWLNLFQTYGLDRDAVVVGLVPEAVDGCGGVGWAVPDLEILREARGRDLTIMGGIAHSRMPDYSGTDRWALEETGGRVAVLAMEVMHGWHDHRHVSNLHNEASGCPLTANAGGDLLGFVTEALGLGLDMSCYKLEVHPHGTIGSYPPTVVRSGRPGDVSGTLGGSRIFGNLGGFGVRIDPVLLDGGRSTYRLTMYDPCPSGPLDVSDPMIVLSQRADPATGYNCRVNTDSRGVNRSESQQPHDIMSYGSPAKNRWYSIQRIPGLKNIREGL